MIERLKMPNTTVNFPCLASPRQATTAANSICTNVEMGPIGFDDYPPSAIVSDWDDVSTWRISRLLFVLNT